MKKLFLIAPVVLLMACGGETKDEMDHAEEAIDNMMDKMEEIVEEVEEVEMPELVTSSLSSDDEIKTYLEGKSWESQETHESGMHIIKENEGEGDERPTLADEVTIFYQGYLLDGTRFDGTADIPATFPLSNLIQGWQIGIPMFGKGGKGKLIIPSELAYGDRDNGAIPGGSTLLFEIELIDWSSRGM